MANQVAEGRQLPLMEEFYTIQGEGYHAGRAAYFVRLGGCDVGCHWCDVKESWDAAQHPLVAVDDLIARVLQYPAKIVVVTGGEPFMYSLDYLTTELRRYGIQTFVETSGAYPVSGTWDWICFSPKKFKFPDPSVHLLANELKVVVFNKSDFLWAEAHAAQVSPNCKLYLQPEWSKVDTMMPLIVDYVKLQPRWQISLQTHKIIDVP